MPGKNRRRILNPGASLEHRFRQISALAGDCRHSRNPNQIQPHPSQQPSSADDTCHNGSNQTCNRAFDSLLWTYINYDPATTESAATIVSCAVTNPDDRKE